MSLLLCVAFILYLYYYLMIFLQAYVQKQWQAKGWCVLCAKSVKSVHISSNYGECPSKKAQFCYFHYRLARFNLVWSKTLSLSTSCPLQFCVMDNPVNIIACFKVVCLMKIGLLHYLFFDLKETFLKTFTMGNQIFNPNFQSFLVRIMLSFFLWNSEEDENSQN